MFIYRIYLDIFPTLNPTAWIVMAHNVEEATKLVREITGADGELDSVELEVTKLGVVTADVAHIHTTPHIVCSSG